LEILGWGVFGYETMGPKWIGETNGSHLLWVCSWWVFQNQSHIHNSKRKTTQKRRKAMRRRRWCWWWELWLYLFCCCCCVEVRASHLCFKKWSKMHLCALTLSSHAKISHLIKIMFENLTIQGTMKFVWSHLVQVVGDLCCMLSNSSSHQVPDVFLNMFPIAPHSIP
jgi:hypothetical protein